MKLPCGCCAGIEIDTPEPEPNRPGLSAIAYRVGTYATFFESMLARLSNLYLDVPAADGSGALERIYPLHTLTTRDPSDPSIALLDAWAVVGDVLTFYQERIANEGYLGTARERLSILELARLVGDKLRPGVSASVYLAFTVASGFNGTIPAGTRAQSIPGTGEMPQFFETSANLAARDVWNDLGVRLTRPQIVTLASSPSGLTATIDEGTDALTRDTLYFQGSATNLNVGDALLIVSGDGPGQQVLRVVESVTAQPDQKRTEVTLQISQPALQFKGSTDPAKQALDTLQAALGPFVADAEDVFPGSALASQVAALLEGLISSAQALAQSASSTATDVADLIPPVQPQVQALRDIAAKRNFTRLEPWIGEILAALNSLVQQLPGLDDVRGEITLPPLSAGVLAAPSALQNLFGILDQLALPPSLQPANTFRLARSVQQTFAPESDTAPRLLAAFKPAIATTLYHAWGAIEKTPSQIQVFAMRAKGAAFGNNAPLQINITNGTLQPPTEWPLSAADSGNPSSFSMDAVYNKVTPGSWVVINRTGPGAAKQPLLITQVTSVQPVSRADYGMSARVTQLSLGEQWLTSVLPPPGSTTADIPVLRGATVYAQAEELTLAEEPLDRDVEGSTIELDGLYDGLESGRWIIVSGNRTDITDQSGATNANATGVQGNELVMIAGVTQGPSKQSYRPITLGGVPFGSVYYVTAPNAAGDALVVGLPNIGLAQFLSTIPLPNTADNNQQICDPVERAPGLYANAYLPTAAERNGDFSAFTGLLVDPATNQPFSPDGVIPQSRIDPTDPKNNPTPVWAWRITNIASGQDTLHTTLELANSLAYSYDSSTVTIYGNVAKATHGQTVGEVLGNGDGSQPLQKFTLGQSPLTYLPAPTPSGAESTLVVRVNEVEWHEADSLAGLGPRDRDYVTQTDDAAKTSVIFGTGDEASAVPTYSGQYG